MYTAEVFQSGTNWHLMLSIDDRVTNLWSKGKLIEVVELASCLQIHITNLSELPLTQYSIQGESYE